ncbi:MAG TPA: hypothetical protein VNE62_02140, partial [Actinomycetota bacterium]|nr:hypothetical protein [Actinomycetota bacterium]
MGWGSGKKVVEAARRNGVRTRVVAEGDVIATGRGIRLEVLAPGPDPPRFEDRSLIDRNNLVVKARVAGVDVLVPGDVDLESQEALSSLPVAAPVLVAVHHGSANLDPEFVRAVSPKVTLVTVGADNSYGHPTAKAMELYRREGMVLRNDTQGTLSLCIDDGEVEVRTAR